MLFFAVLGAIAAVAAFGFKRTLTLFEEVFERHPVPQPLRAMVGGLLVGLLALYVPAIAGNGYEPLNLILDQRVALGSVFFLLVAKIIATGASVGCGVPGGVFTPTLLIGASVGTLLAPVANTLSPAAPAGSYALVGMAAATAASIHAPITAAVLVFELSGDYAIVLPLLVATVAATAISRGMGSDSVYEAELRRKGVSWQLTIEGRRTARHDVPRSHSDSGPAR